MGPVRSTAWQRRLGGAAHGEVVVAARGGLGAACPREERPAGMPGGARGGSRVHLAVVAPLTRSTGGVRAGGERERVSGRREIETGAEL